MNAFDYVVKLQEIQKAKTQKAIKEIVVPLVKDYRDAIQGRSWGREISYIPSVSTTADNIRYYHIFRIGVDNYNGDSLQDFVVRSCRNLERHITDQALSGQLSYEEFMEAFKYSKSITLDGSMQRITNTIMMIDNRQLPCRVLSSLSTSSNYTYLFSKVKDNLNYSEHTLELEAFKREQGRDDLTLLNQLLDQYYEININELSKKDANYKIHSTVIDELRIDMDTLMKETQRRLNEQANIIQDPLHEAV